MLGSSKGPKRGFRVSNIGGFGFSNGSKRFLGGFRMFEPTAVFQWGTRRDLHRG